MAKRAKRATVQYIETKSEYSTYTCPHCYTQVIGANIGRHITRFKCTECHNEIIINNP